MIALPDRWLLCTWKDGRVTTEATALSTPYFPTDVRLLRTAHRQADLNSTDDPASVPDLTTDH